MYREKIRLHFIYLLIDIFFIVFSFYFAYVLRARLHFVPVTVAAFRHYSLIFILWGLTLVFLINNYRLYSTDRALTIPQETLKVFKATIYCAVLLAVIIFALKIDFFSRLIFIGVTLFLFINLSFWRMLKRIFVRYRILNGYNNFNILIVGAGKSAKVLAEEINDNPYVGLRVVGFLDDYKTEGINGYKVLGKIEDLERVVQKKFIDEVYISIPSERKVVSNILAKVRALGKTARILADNF